ncbi:hypothetical protein HMPREF1633_02155 [Tissierellia bacterium S5-A11]|nr:hypothetical protein HMPREF1633_02155 [Tissierellia bacterium S5-A11]
MSATPGQRKARKRAGSRQSNTAITAHAENSESSNPICHQGIKKAAAYNNPLHHCDNNRECVCTCMQIRSFRNNTKLIIMRGMRSVHADSAKALCCSFLCSVKLSMVDK